MMDSVAKVKQKLRSGGISIGAWLLLGSPAQAKEMIQLGFRLLSVGWDAGFILEGAQSALKEIHLQ